MVVTSLDAIVKNVLLKRGYPLQYYIDFLVYGKDVLREISIDDNIQCPRRVVVPVDQNTFMADIPEDCMDGGITGVYARVDQYLRPLVPDDSLDTIPNYDSNFDVQPYANGVASQSASSQSNNFYPTNNSGYWWAVNWNVFGENLGRMFGGISGYIDTYSVDKAANNIKLNERLAITEVVIEYVGDGTDADAATHITTAAIGAMESGMLWQFYLHNRTYQTYDVQTQYQNHMNQRQILRARTSDLDLVKIKRAVQRNNIRTKY